MGRPPTRDVVVRGHCWGASRGAHQHFKQLLVDGQKEGAGREIGYQASKRYFIEKIFRNERKPPLEPFPFDRDHRVERPGGYQVPTRDQSKEGENETSKKTQKNIDSQTVEATKSAN